MIIVVADGFTIIMGFFDALIRQADAIRHAAEAALEFTRNLAREAERKLIEAKDTAERLATEIKHKVENTAGDLQRELKTLTPSFEGKLKELTDQVTEVAQNAADDGLDITEAIDGAVEVALKALEDALNAAIDAINRFLNEASKKLFNFLGGYLPHFILKPIIATVDFVLESLASLGDQLKYQISSAVQRIKVTVQNLVRRIGEVLGPIWQFIKKLWKILFGVEPEQCALTAAWFDERLKRTEKQLLHRRSGEPVSALIKRRTFFELLPPVEDSWKQSVLSFLDRVATTSVWFAHRARMQSLLTESSPNEGSLVQLTLDEPFTDRLGGHQCLQLSVLYYRWRTEEFRKVSSGFLGILVMISAVGGQEDTDDPPIQMIQREPPLQMDAGTIKKIYKEIEPHMWLSLINVDQESKEFDGRKKNMSRHLMSRDNDGTWRSFQ